MNFQDLVSYLLAEIFGISIKIRQIQSQ